MAKHVFTEGSVVVTKHDRRLNDAQAACLNDRGLCPDCGSGQFVMGPSGGAAVNIQCHSCKECFWFAPPFTPERIQRYDELYTRPPVNLYEEVNGMIAPVQRVAPRPGLLSRIVGWLRA